MSQNLKSIFIDGEAGTTGLGIRERLAAVPEVAVKSIDPDKRKDPAARKEMMAGVDLVVLCLPDEAAKESVALADELGADAPKIVDAATAHRIAPGWVYGFAELAPGHAEKIAKADRVANPGCYPTGAIALLRPLVDAGLMAQDHPVTVNAVSGYSGGGKSMIEEFETGVAPAFELYGLGLRHKHLPELQAYARLTRRPIFVPSVGNFRQGMLVSVPLHLDTLPGRPSVGDLHHALAERYASSTYVNVLSQDGTAGKIEPEALNDTNKLELRVFGQDDLGQAVLVARLDNLGKGASGAAVQNISLMLGLPEG
ncbi:N-acetyl-gamma-glutamyl-phosphate reductase [Bosea sp. NBC_00550]|uniref:N-acetyl-gamma-glutamyl-phosphate reductase n=1 Tax=Bosea sp. NBC_00550 TaxID=2969621 RepID=UPI002230B0C3|nr:N-acetyl-gamma-glutamyl-phosphate reductase [Bosea sp. NBC_00550]UZF93158.1 N-acetyl-gamma-glutamyl-phosphate reductase [Bosea sp. NBC_00550]